MKRLHQIVPLVIGLALFTTFQAQAADETTRSKLPPELKVAAGYHRVLESVGRGVQIYDCVDGVWKFREPAASISDRRDKVVAIHSAGPTWQSINDGSKVAAAVKARLDAPDPQHDIPWLLLEATSNTGPGLFADVQYIQRLDTDGGVAPVGACTTGSSVGVPYKATYAFWASRAN